MSAVKHQPATPLPFQVGGTTGDGSIAIKAGPGRFVAFVVEGGVLTGEVAEKNAAYIAHAANAYPNLIEALNDVMQVAPECRAGSGGSECGECRCCKARSLLQKLGEAV